MRALVTGWFSFELMGATAGDLLAKDQTCAWLAGAGIPHDVALASPFPGGVDCMQVDPSRYTHLIFVCGPFHEFDLTSDYLERFAHCRKIGLNVSMLRDLSEWNPFDVLYERDSSRAARPDITFLSDARKVPVVGLCLVLPQNEYGERGRHAEANAAIDRLLNKREVAVVKIDTRLDDNKTGLRTPCEIESLIARVDVLVTTRLHGTVLALKNGVPAVAVDPIAGGAKILRQANHIGWPHVVTADELDDAALRDMFDACCTPEAGALARQCAERARELLSPVRESFVRDFSPPNSGRLAE